VGLIEGNSPKKGLGRIWDLEAGQSLGEGCGNRKSVESRKGRKIAGIV